MTDSNKQSLTSRVTKDVDQGPCEHPGCDNKAYKRYHKGWQKWLFSKECKSCTANLKKYGIHTGQRNEIYKAQDGKCKTCYSPVEFRQGYALSTHDATLDHCHKTGRIRGILCGRCNNILGRANDDPELFKKLVAYLKGHKDET